MTQPWLAISMLLFVTGCVVTPEDIQKAEEFCAGHGGWNRIFQAPDESVIICNDDSQIEVELYTLAAQGADT